MLRNGKQVVVHEIPVAPAAATAAVPRIQRLAEHPHPSLSPILAWGTEANDIWVAVEPNEGTPRIAATGWPASRTSPLAVMRIAEASKPPMATPAS